MNSGPVAPIVTFAPTRTTLSTTPVPPPPAPSFSSLTSSSSGASSSFSSSPPPFRPLVSTAPAAPVPAAPAPAAPVPAAPAPAAPVPAAPSPTGGGFQVTSSPASVPAGQTGLFLADGIPDISTSSGGNVNFSIPAAAFAHTDGNASVQLSAQQSDGQALPTWLKFDPATGKFSGTPPPGTNGDVAIKVLARDSTGKEAVAIFHVKVETPAPDQPQTDDQGAVLKKQAPWLKTIRLASLTDGDESGRANHFFGKPGFSRQFAEQGRDGLLSQAMKLQRAAERLARQSTVS